MDFDILYAIQHLRCDFLDQFILILTKAAGDYGHVWLIVGALLLPFRKTRKAGIAVLLSYALVYVIGQFALKDWIARPRPCHIDETVELLIKRPSSFSCPSTHSAWAFAAATAISMEHRKAGIALFTVAVLIAFSRLYLFVHFPTDVLFGAVLGAICGIAAVYLVRFVFRKLEARKGKKN